MYCFSLSIHFHSITAWWAVLQFIFYINSGYSYLGPPLYEVNFCLWIKLSLIKCTLVQALRLCTGRTAHRRSRGIALLFLDHGARRGEGSAARPGSSLPSGKTRYPLYRRLVGPQGRSGQVLKFSTPTGIRSWDRPARSQSLYRLRYLALLIINSITIVCS